MSGAHDFLNSRGEFLVGAEAALHEQVRIRHDPHVQANEIGVSESEKPYTDRCERQGEREIERCFPDGAPLRTDAEGVGDVRDEQRERKQGLNCRRSAYYGATNWHEYRRTLSAPRRA